MFNTARIKLTAWYVVILMSVSIAFSIVIYRGMSMEVERFAYLQRIRFERRFTELGIPPPPFADEEIIQEMKNHVVVVLLGINGVILFVMGGLSYFLAGQTLRPIQEMMETQDRFISDASHELKTPLTAMKSSLEVYVRDPKLTLSEAKSVLKDNINEVNRLQLLSESLLTLSESDIKSSFISVRLDDVMNQSVRLIMHSAEKKQIRIHTPSLAEITVQGDKAKLIELFVIIFDNAVKYSEKNSSVIISKHMPKKGIEINIQDEGCGIDEKDLPHIFDRFYRSDSARKKQEIGGYGLGLSIAKKITEVHDGTITITSKQQKGTTVSLWFPTI
ncbi:MAG: HAMP domain-containing sensor histidine kinase [Microgenomates group bacterium]